MEHQLAEQKLSVDETSNPDYFSTGTYTENDDLLQWFDVAGSGKLDDMKNLLLHGADVGWEDDAKRTALHICAGYGYYELVSLLLEHGAAVNAKDENSTTALHLATWHGKTEVVRLLIDHDADLEANDDNLETALYMAVSHGFKKIVQLLLHRGASIHARGYRSQTALHLASSIGYKEVVKLLLYNGAMVDAKNEHLDTALHKAAENGHLGVVELLLNGDASAVEKNTDSWTAIHLAARSVKNDVVELLIDRGVAADIKGLLLRTPLHWAALNGNEETVKILLNHGASIDAADDLSNTPLILASRFGQGEVVSILLQNGAFVDWKNDVSNTALDEAVRFERVDNVRILLSYGASIQTEDEKRDTPFHVASKYGHKEVLSLLLSNFKCVNQKFKDGRTLLAERSEAGDIQMVMFLLQHGADIEALDINGHTPLVIALKAAQPHMVSFLINEGADIEVTDNNLWTALHWSANEGHVAILELLLHKKANIEAKTKHGNTALHLAAKSNRSEVVATLIEYDANLDARNEFRLSPIQVAIMKGHYKITLQLKNAGATIGSSEDYEQWLLYQAADAGQVELVKKALEQYDEVERTRYMNTALCRASEYGQVDVVSYFLDNGANIETCNYDGLPLLFLAGEHSEVISKLLDCGACIEARSLKHQNQSVLHYFASLGRIGALRLLRACECNFHSIDDNDNTALHYAVKNDHHEVTIMLLEQGVDINATNNEGETALHIAIKHGSTELAKLLIDNGIDIETKTLTGGTTVLHLAIENESPAIISLLLERHADINAIDELEYTPLEYAIMTLNPDMVKLLLQHGASVYSQSIDFYPPLNYLIDNCLWVTSYQVERSLIEMVKLLIDAGASTAGITISEEDEESFPTLRGMLEAPSNLPINIGNNILDEPSIKDQHFQEKDYTDIALKRFGGDRSEEYETSICNERWLIHTKQKYGYGLPLSKRLKLEDVLDVDGTKDHDASTDSIQFPLSFKFLTTVPMCNRAISTIQSLLVSYGAQLFMSDYFFMLELDVLVASKPPKWASHFDKMDGIIREPGRLIVQIPQIQTSLSIPAWHKNIHPCLRFIDAVYVCRRSSTRLDQEVFSELLGGSEQRLATDLHAILIAGLSILSIAGGDGLVEKLVMAILDIKLDSTTIPPSDDTLADWQVHNRRQCPCNAASFHRPLSPVAAAKAVGIDIWQDRDYQVVNRVWDLHQDKLVLDVDAREVIFVTHRWGTNEIRYQDILKMKRWRGQTVGRMSKKLGRIRNALLDHTRYVWMDTICIDKSNLSELDEAIRSMYKWYASCAAVVLDSDTPLEVWCKRGWCLQEGAAAGILRGISKEGNLVTMQQLAKEQHQNLCSLDLHLYYRKGNAAEILARMDVRDTTRKEDMAYSLAGIFDIHLTLAYGEGIKSRMRLFHELATQKGDLSFLSFMTTRSIDRNYLPTINQINYVLAECTEASTSINVSHFGICFEVQLLKAVDAKKTLQMLKSWKLLNFAIGRSSGIDELYEATEKMEHQGLPVELAIVYEIRSLILVQTYNADWQAGGGKPLKLCYRIQCCQIEEIEFERLFDKYRALQYERIWLGDRPRKVNISQFESEWSRRVNI
ncbi:hypothetical protein INT44_003442 [Umbelopsis vinacea]|uniref:Heterokaryon incompatibility domain-containing protein n=1 Tax=Umbelopsis vinacea TaxID=44442 RepID=A0A8H7PUG9_9FUNG|nr:hypothetical protein INT44_003442 [Umbelopsis vinacea]